MAEIIKLRNNPHSEVQDLLPWFLNGTLEGAELERVEAHLAECTECREELAAERRLASAVKGAPIGSRTDWQRIGGRLEGTARPNRPRSSPLWQKHVPLSWLVASQLAAAAAIAVVAISLPPHRSEPIYRALGSAQTVRSANVIVQFQPATRVGDMQSVLQSVDARLVDGPTTTGAYLLQVDQSTRSRAIDQLHHNKAIALAEPIDNASRQ